MVSIYEDIQNEKKYNNYPFFSKGDNCYSWARRRLLALNEPKIKTDLPSNGTDYFVMRPKWKLQESLVAADHA